MKVSVMCVGDKRLFTEHPVVEHSGPNPRINGLTTVCFLVYQRLPHKRGFVPTVGVPKLQDLGTHTIRAAIIEREKCADG